MADGEFCLRQLVGEIYEAQFTDVNRLHELEDQFRQRTEPVGEHWVKASCDNCAAGVMAIYGIDTRFAETDDWQGVDGANLDDCPNPITKLESRAILSFIYRDDSVIEVRYPQRREEPRLPF